MPQTEQRHRRLVVLDSGGKLHLAERGAYTLCRRSPWRRRRDSWVLESWNSKTGAVWEREVGARCTTCARRRGDRELER